MHWLDGQILSQAGCGLRAAADLLISCDAVGDTVGQQHECQTAHAWHYTFKTSPENMFMWSCVTLQTPAPLHILHARGMGQSRV